jgi:soluble lytic murein transglycosylase-like protein
MALAFVRAARIAIAHVLLVAAAAHAQVSPAYDACFDRHAERFGLDATLLRAIAVVESGMRPHVDGAPLSSGTRDIGLMQINTSWLPALSRYGIALKDLRDPCTSIEVGAWILSDLVQRHGNTWDALAAYNAACTQLKGRECRQTRSAYAWRVWRAMQQGMQPGAIANPHPGAPAARPTGLVAANSSSLVLESNP